MGRKKKTPNPPPDRRDAIIEAALRCYIEFGIAHTSGREIAKLAQVDPPLIHYYFPGREELHLAVIQKVLASLVEHSVKAIERYPEEHERHFRAYLRAPLEWAKTNPKLMQIWMYFYYTATQSGAFRELNEKIRKTGRDRIAKIIYEGIEQKIYHVARGTKVADLAIEIQAQMSGMAILCATENGLSFEECANLLEKRIFSMLNARS